MYISVIPLARSLHLKPYVYIVTEPWEEQITIGGLVEIPIGKHIEHGIIASINDNINIDGEIRPIISVIAKTSLLSQGEISVILALAEKYMITLHRVIRLFLPTPLLSRLEKRNYLLSCPTKSIKKDYKSREIHHFVKKIFSPGEKEKYQDDDTVWCFPDDFFIYSFFGDMSKNTETLIATNEATPAKKSQQWIDVYEGKYRILVGTRRILYYNLHAYKKLIYVEDAFANEQYYYPHHIQNLDILRYLSDNTDIDIIIISSSPTLSLLANFRDFTIRSM